VVLAVERDRAKRDYVAYALENLAAVRAAVLGTVLLERAPKPAARRSRERSSAAYATRSQAVDAGPRRSAPTTSGPAVEQGRGARPSDQASR
jgi:hypothetical protein